MNGRDHGKAALVGVTVLVVIAIGAVILIERMQTTHPVSIIPPSTAPATLPATLRTTQPAPAPPENLLGVLRANDRNYPTTQELEIPANYEQAAHVVLDQPAYLCPLGHLWITDPRGKPTATVLANLAGGNSHVVSDTIVFAHWQMSDSGKWTTSLVRKNPTGGFELVQTKRTSAVGTNRAYDWGRAIAWDDKIVVPTDQGVSVISVGDPTKELYQSLVEENASTTAQFSAPVILFDTRGIITWMPWESGKTGSHGAARFVDGKWQRLDASQGWPDKIVHLMPLLDGSVLQLLPNDDGSIRLAMTGVTRDSAQIDEAGILKLVDQLSDPDQINRDKAYEQLTRYGPGAFPVLQKIQENQPPEAQSRINELLKSKLSLTLGPITPEPGPVTTVARLRDGGVVFYCDSGVSVARGSAESPTLVAPAWISIRPGYPVQVLPDRLVRDLQPGKQRLWAFKSEWIVGSEAQGLRWFVGNYLSILENKDERKQFTEFVGIDNHGRWIMRASNVGGPTLIVDPNLPDPTPRLPTWVYVQREGTVGWTNTNWPAVKPNGIAVLDSGARREPTKDEKFFEHVSDEPAPEATTAPTTMATTGPATTQDSADLILVDSDGTRYYDGSNTIRIRRPGIAEQTWPLPPTAVGTGDVWLFHCEDRFFLFNQAGRAIRLRSTPDGPEPFVLEAVFTHNIPNVDNSKSWIDRIWLDPAGRLVIALNGNTLAILFPSGRIPSEIRQMMPPEKEGE